MRRLASVHNISNSNRSIWEEDNSFVAYLLIGRMDESLYNFVNRHWVATDLLTGKYLYVIVTALSPEDVGPGSEVQILRTEHKASEKLLDRFGLTFDSLPCLLFVEGPKEGRCFCYKLGSVQSSAKSIARFFRQVTSACKEYQPKSGLRTEESFSSLHQALKVLKCGEMLGPILSDLSPQILFAFIKRGLGL